MKQLITVVAVALFAAFSQSFTTSSSTANGKGILLEQPATAPFSTLANPWTGAKKITAPLITWNFDKYYTPSSNVYYHIYVNGTLVIDRNYTDYGSFSVANGAVVRLEAAYVNMPSYYAFIAYINDNYNGGSTEIYFKDTPGVVDTSFVAQTDHSYDLYVRD